MHGEVSAADWWRALHPEDPRWLQGSLGHLVLSVQRDGSEWLVHSEHLDDRSDRASWVELSEDEPDLAEGAVRFLFDGPADALELRPTLADRPVIAKPKSPIIVPHGQNVTVYIGTPLWVQLLQSGRPEVLAEFSAERLSLTWFGVSTRVGEVCYSTSTSAHLNLENFPAVPSYAITRVSLLNEGSEPLRFKQVKLPLATLSLLTDDRGQHFTEPVSMTQTPGGLTQIARQPIDADDPLFRDLTRVGEPRIPVHDRNLVETAIDRLFR